MNETDQVVEAIKSDNTLSAVITEIEQECLSRARASVESVNRAPSGRITRLTAEFGHLSQHTNELHFRDKSIERAESYRSGMIAVAAVAVDNAKLHGEELLDGIRNVLCAVVKERQRQDVKWGEQNLIPVIWLAILAEEMGEAAIEVDNYISSQGEVSLRGDYRKELVETAAVCVAAILSLDRSPLSPSWRRRVMNDISAPEITQPDLIQYAEEIK